PVFTHYGRRGADAATGSKADQGGNTCRARHSDADRAINASGSQFPQPTEDRVRIKAELSDDQGGHPTALDIAPLLLENGPTLLRVHVGMTCRVPPNAEGSNARTFKCAGGDEIGAVDERTGGLGTISRDDEAAFDARLCRGLVQIGLEFLERGQTPRREV